MAKRCDRRDGRCAGCVRRQLPRLGRVRAAKQRARQGLTPLVKVRQSHSAHDAAPTAPPNIDSLRLVAPVLRSLLSTLRYPTYSTLDTRSHTMTSATAAATASSSGMGATRRLLKELSENQAHPNPCLARLAPVSDEDLTHWRAILLGPPHSLYEGCRWEIDIRVPDQYPHVPPEMRFITPCCHPNVHLKVYLSTIHGERGEDGLTRWQTGEICLDLLRGTSWTPTLTISSALTMVQQLLTDPEPDSPLNVDAAAVMRFGDAVGYESLVRVWGVLYAGKPPTTR